MVHVIRVGSKSRHTVAATQNRTESQATDERGHLYAPDSICGVLFESFSVALKH